LNVLLLLRRKPYSLLYKAALKQTVDVSLGNETSAEKGKSDFFVPLREKGDPLSIPVPGRKDSEWQKKYIKSSGEGQQAECCKSGKPLVLVPAKARTLHISEPGKEVKALVCNS